ncbi:MAG: hypothetical protein GXO26_07550, partial [Crenarchaeota archaeon]|nr:hypothetical protein [Thermoproteota archaeon]
MPTYNQLNRMLENIPYSDMLTEVEKLSVLRGLERVWHIMRILRLLSTYFSNKIIFGGGAILNYIYMINNGEVPRLTFDLDASWYRAVRSKRVILKEMVEFNKWLAEQGELLLFPVTSDGRRTPLYHVEYDVDKDFFPYLLSLRVPVITRYDGEV